MSGYNLKPINGMFYVRWRQKGDIDSFVEIDTFSSEYLWTREDFKSVFREANINCFVVTTSPGKVVGFLIYEKGRNRHYILNLSVHPDYRRRGVGRILLNKLKSKIDWTRREIRFDVRESNLSAQLFLRSESFRCEKIIENYFLDFYGDEDDEVPERENAYSFYHTPKKQECIKENEVCVGR